MDRDAAQQLFARCDTLAAAITRGLALGWNVVEVIHQDEFTLDVVLLADPGGPAVVLDTT